MRGLGLALPLLLLLLLSAGTAADGGACRTAAECALNGRCESGRRFTCIFEQKPIGSFDPDASLDIR